MSHHKFPVAWSVWTSLVDAFDVTIAHVTTGSKLEIFAGNGQVVWETSVTVGAETTDWTDNYLPSSAAYPDVDSAEAAIFASRTGQKTASRSLPVVVASNQSDVPVKQGTKAALAGAWPMVPTDAAGNAISSQLDAGIRRLEIAGKVSVVGSVPPPATNAFAVFADTPLVVGANDTAVVIPDGETLHIQSITGGNEDPTKGAQVEVVFNDGTEHVVGRFFTSGHSLFFGFADVTQARDGTALTGNGTNTLIVRRLKFSGTDIAIDAVLRGYTV